MKKATKSEKRIAEENEIENTSKRLLGISFTRLMALSDIVNRYVKIALKDEINWLKLRALIIIAGHGKGTITPSELAATLLRSKQNVTAIIDDLEKDGLVVKLREPGDRRVITVRITNWGLEHIEDSLNKISLAENELRFCLDEKELEAIATLLVKIRCHMVDLLMKDPNHLKVKAKEDSQIFGRVKIKRGQRH